MLKPVYLLTTLAMLCTMTVQAQKLKQKHLDQLATNNISLIDSNILYNNVLKNDGKVTVVLIFTNHCVGTPHAFKNIETIRNDFGDKVAFVLCSSSSRKRIDDLVAVAKANNNKEKLYFIDPNKYKEYGMDDRKKGFQFRNDVCKPCEEDVIGTPYYIIYSPDNEVLFYGYNSRKDFHKLLTEYFQQNG